MQCIVILSCRYILPTSIRICYFPFANNCRWMERADDSQTGAASLHVDIRQMHRLMLHCLKKKEVVRFWKARGAKRKQKPQVDYVSFFNFLWWWWWWWWVAFRSLLSSLLTVSSRIAPQCKDGCSLRYLNTDDKTLCVCVWGGSGG